MLDLAGTAFVLTAGLFTLLSPCGYALLPGYVSYYLGEESDFKRGLLGGISSGSGLILVYSVLGAIASMIGSALYPYAPTMILLSALVITLLGLASLGRWSMRPFRAIPFTARRGYFGFFLFGIAYGMAASGCTAPIFFSVLLYSVAASGPISGLAAFLLYSVGIGAPLVGTSLLASGARRSLIERMRRAGYLFNRLSGGMLIAVGAYLVYYYGSTYGF